MSTGSDTDQPDVDRLQYLPQGRVAGRLVDGVDLIIDGVPAGRRPPRWERQLASIGYDPDAEGSIAFAVEVEGLPGPEWFADVRSALEAARRAVEAGRDPREVEVRAVTPSGRSVSVVTGTPIVGMAIGAIEDPPITVIEGPSALPEYAPGEQRPMRRRRRHRR
jgi:hypothetical protein